MIDWTAVGAVIAALGFLATCAGFFIYMGRSLGALDSIKQAVMVALAKVDRHETTLTEVQSRLSRVETRQEDCVNCP